MKFTAVQFDPDKPYPEAAWAHGPGSFFASTPNRGHVPISKSDWILDFEMEPVNDQPVVERVVVSNTLYHAFFEPLKEKPVGEKLIEESEHLREVLSSSEESKKADDSEESGKSSKPDPVAGKDSKSRK